MKVIIKGKFRDIISFVLHIKKRNRIFKKTKAKALSPGKINLQAEKLHPLNQRMQIRAIIDECPGVKTYQLEMLNKEKKPAFFRAGQYLSFYFKVENSTVYRPFSISSPPIQCLTEGTYDITVKKANAGFIDSYIFDHWKVGNEVVCTGPSGNFYYQPLRDKENLICMGGGSGITPFKSIISDLLSSDSGVNIILFHGAMNSNQLIFKSGFESMEKDNPNRFRYIPICSEPKESWQGEKGFIDSALIKKSLKDFLPTENILDCSYFLCGPPLMEGFISPQLEKLGIPLKNRRNEQFATNNIQETIELKDPKEKLISLPKKQTKNLPDEFTIVVHRNKDLFRIKAKSNETILVALERAGLNPPSLCRSGSCGWCRSKLISGKAQSIAKNEGLRAADKKFGYIHPCSTRPLSDMEIKIPDNPVKTV